MQAGVGMHLQHLLLAVLLDSLYMSCWLHLLVLELLLGTQQCTACALLWALQRRCHVLSVMVCLGVAVAAACSVPV